MIEESIRIAEILFRRHMGPLGKEDLKILEQWLQASEENRLLIKNFDDDEWFDQRWKEYNQAGKYADLPAVRRRMPDLRREHFSRTRSFRWAAALTIVLGVGLGARWIYYRISGTEEALAQTTNDLLPARNSATLYLSGADGILLDKQHPGPIGRQGCTEIYKKENGNILFAINTDCTDEQQRVEFLPNVLKTPPGGLGEVTFSDSSSVQLNAASSIVFPVRFSDQSRIVELTGEGYFQVKQAGSGSGKTRKPFVVRVHSPAITNGLFSDSDLISITAYGTSFNIKAYKEDSSIRAALMTGSILIERHGDSVRLRPGQVYVLRSDGTSSVQQPEETHYTIPWRERQFSFSNEPADQVLEEIGRWYNATIVFEERITAPVTFDCSRGLRIRDVLDLMTANNNFHYVINGNTIIVRR